MSVHRRQPRNLAAIVLAVPVIAAVYLTALARSIVMLPRTIVVATLGALVVSSVYADEACRRAPDGVRRSLDSLPARRVTPAGAALALALAVVLVGAGAPAAPATAAMDRAEAAVQAARGYLGIPYRLGATGPNKFDCSGLIFRIFADTDQLALIGGKRMRAVHYLKWFTRRGLATKRDAVRGDLVVWGDGAHIGIYLGKGRAISALTDTGVTVHGVHAISYRFTTFLKVQWTTADEVTGTDARPGKKKNRDKPNQDEASESVTEPEAPEVVEEETVTGLATGTMNLRLGHSPDEKIIGWVRPGNTFTILDTGYSPSGALWYSIETRSGKTGWIYSRWVTVLEE